MSVVLITTRDFQSIKVHSLTQNVPPGSLVMKLPNGTFLKIVCGPEQSPGRQRNNVPEDTSAGQRLYVLIALGIS